MTDEVAGKKMVAGFLFSGTRVLLVEKTRPEWQRGLLNGVGGVIENSETPIAAMHREFREETGYGVELPWRHFCTEIEPTGAWVYFFSAQLYDQHAYAWPHANDVGEVLRWQSADGLHPGRALGNLHWLIPLSRDPRLFVRPIVVEALGDIRKTTTW